MMMIFRAGALPEAKVGPLSSHAGLAAFLISLATLVGILGVPSPAVAILADVHGTSARSIGMAGAFTAVADDFSAAYFNPAGLAQIGNHRICVDYFYNRPWLKVGTGGVGSRIAVDSTVSAPIIGLVLDFTKMIKLPFPVVFGLSSYWPGDFKSVYKTRYGVAFDPFFPMYGDNTENMALGTYWSIGMRPFDWLAVGLGVNFMANTAKTLFPIEVQLGGNPCTPDMDLIARIVEETSKNELQVTTEISPIVGLLFFPVEGLRLSFVWRERLEFMLADSLAVTNIVGMPAIPGLNPLVLVFPVQSHFSPEQVAVGAAYQVTPRLLMALDITYYDWSPYRDNAGSSPNPLFRKILVPRLGVEYNLKEAWILRGGYYYRPTPVPDQKPPAKVDYLDSDTHFISLGAGYGWKTPWTRFPVELNLFVQAQVLAPNWRDSVHDGEADLQSKGIALSAGGGLSFTF